VDGDRMNASTGSLRLVDELVGLNRLLGDGADGVLEDVAVPPSHWGMLRGTPRRQERIGPMEDQSPTLWLVIVTGAAAGLLSSIVGYALLGLPLVKVKTQHHVHVDDDGEPHVRSYVKVANVRGRPVGIEQVLIFKRHTTSRPLGWTFGMELSEGQSVKFAFDREEYPNAVPIMIDSAGRVWPRRRWFRVRRRAMGYSGLRAFFPHRNGPSDRQIERAMRASDKQKAEESRGHGAEGAGSDP
jgi:hypothetical protein